MIELSTNTVQTIQPGGSVTFDRVKYQSRRGCECFNDQIPTSVKLCSSGVYLLTFHSVATASAADTQLQLTIAVGGTPMSDTNMDVKPAAVGDLWNMSATTLYDNWRSSDGRFADKGTGSYYGYTPTHWAMEPWQNPSNGVRMGYPSPEHMAQSVREMWNSADPKTKERLKEDMTHLVEEMD